MIISLIVYSCLVYICNGCSPMKCITCLGIRRDLKVGLLEGLETEKCELNFEIMECSICTMMLMIGYGVNEYDRNALSNVDMIIQRDCIVEPNTEKNKCIWKNKHRKDSRVVKCTSTCYSNMCNDKDLTKIFNVRNYIERCEKCTIVKYAKSNITLYSCPNKEKELEMCFGWCYVIQELHSDRIELSSGCIHDIANDEFKDKIGFSDVDGIWSYKLCDAVMFSICNHISPSEINMKEFKNIKHLVEENDSRFICLYCITIRYTGSKLTPCELGIQSSNFNVVKCKTGCISLFLTDGITTALHRGCTETYNIKTTPEATTTVNGKYNCITCFKTCISRNITCNNHAFVHISDIEDETISHKPRRSLRQKTLKYMKLDNVHISSNHKPSLEQDQLKLAKRLAQKEPTNTKFFRKKYILNSKTNLRYSNELSMPTGFGVEKNNFIRCVIGCSSSTDNQEHNRLIRMRGKQPMEKRRIQELYVTSEEVEDWRKNQIERLKNDLVDMDEEEIPDQIKKIEYLKHASNDKLKDHLLEKRRIQGIQTPNIFAVYMTSEEVEDWRENQIERLKNDLVDMDEEEIPDQREKIEYLELASNDELKEHLVEDGHDSSRWTQINELKNKLDTFKNSDNELKYLWTQVTKEKIKLILYKMNKDNTESEIETIDASIIESTELLRDLEIRLTANKHAISKLIKSIKKLNNKKWIKEIDQISKKMLKLEKSEEYIIKEMQFLKDNNNKDKPHTSTDPKILYYESEMMAMKLQLKRIENSYENLLAKISVRTLANDDVNRMEVKYDKLKQDTDNIIIDMQKQYKEKIMTDTEAKDAVAKTPSIYDSMFGTLKDYNQNNMPKLTIDSGSSLGSIENLNNIDSFGGISRGNSWESLNSLDYDEETTNGKKMTKQELDDFTKESILYGQERLNMLNSMQYPPITNSLNSLNSLESDEDISSRNKWNKQVVDSFRKQSQNYAKLDNSQKIAYRARMNSIGSMELVQEMKPWKKNIKPNFLTSIRKKIRFPKMSTKMRNILLAGVGLGAVVLGVSINQVVRMKADRVPDMTTTTNEVLIATSTEPINTTTIIHEYTSNQEDMKTKQIDDISTPILEQTKPREEISKKNNSHIDPHKNVLINDQKQYGVVMNDENEKKGKNYSTLSIATVSMAVIFGIAVIAIYNRKKCSNKELNIKSASTLTLSCNAK